ncbi:hypothetical protein ACWKWU_17510 [Chitinophaga lutea]
MKKEHIHFHKPDKHLRLAVLSVNYNVRYDGQFDDGGAKLLLALLPHTLPAAKGPRGQHRNGKHHPEH